MKVLGLSAIVLPLWASSSLVWAQLAPDFYLVDANTASVRAGQRVSPRDYLLQVSGYYFGTAG